MGGGGGGGSCDLRANERPWEKIIYIKDVMTDAHTYGHRDLQTNSAQRGRVGENIYVTCHVSCVIDHV